jgi:hypothetical protein
MLRLSRPTESGSEPVILTVLTDASHAMRRAV